MLVLKLSLTYMKKCKYVMISKGWPVSGLAVWGVENFNIAISLYDDSTY